jgi:hypothetical protein
VGVAARELENAARGGGHLDGGILRHHLDLQRALHPQVGELLEHELRHAERLLLQDLGATRGAQLPSTSLFRRRGPRRRFSPKAR